MPGIHKTPDAYIARSSRLHRLDARLKLQLVLVFLLTIGLLPQGAWGAYILLAAILAAAMLISHVPMKTLIKRSLMIELPFLLVLLPVLFRPGGQDLAVYQLANRAIIISEKGSMAFFSILIKSGLSIQAAVLLNAVTRPMDVLAGMRSLGYPRLLSAVLGLMWRYAYIIKHEAERMLTARAARSGQPKTGMKKTGGSITWRAHVTGSMLGSLFLRSLARSERVYQAMLSRGYDGEVRLVEMIPLSIREKLLLAAASVSAVLFLFAARMIY